MRTVSRSPLPRRDWSVRLPTVVATMDDYVVVRDLAADLVSEGVEATVPATVRETVETIERLIAGGTSEVSQAELAKALNLDRGATSRRVATAINRGYVKNIEERKGRPARLVVGDSMPEEIDVLPAPEALFAALLHRCDVGAGETSPPPNAVPAWEHGASDGR